jgi:uncharacterized protein YndB with AHSA1/START domain
MIALHWETEICASAERVFALLAELRDYDRWLPNSSAFRGTNSISEGPIGVGTTYIEPGPFGVRHGRVTVFVPPTRLAFEQPMTLRPGAMGMIGIRLSMNLMPGAGSVRVRRELELDPQGPVRVVMPLVLPSFRAENARMMRELKDYAERAETADSSARKQQDNNR